MTIEKNNNNIPDYLNEEFFKTTLENGLETKDIEIISLNFTMGSAAGDNYTSNIYRVIVTYKEKKNQVKTISLIIKSIPKKSAIDIFESADIYGKEVGMLFNTIPKMENTLRDTKFAPRAYYSTRDPLDTIVVEDLRASNYTLGDREKGLDEKQCKLVLEKLGKFHAASMKIVEQEPQQKDSLKVGIFTTATINTKAMESFFIDNLELEAKVVAKWPGYEKYAAKIENIRKTVKERILDITRPEENELQVLNHGDLWVNNYMFQYAKDDTQNPLDVIFFDYQGSYFASPALDVNYFLHTSVQFEVLKNRREFLIEEYYYKSFRSTLEKIDYKNIPSLDDIKNEIRRKEFFGFISATALLPVICINREHSSDSSLEALLDKESGDAKRLIGCSTKRFEEIMKYLLKRADDLGILD